MIAKKCGAMDMYCECVCVCVPSLGLLAVIFISLSSFFFKAGISLLPCCFDFRRVNWNRVGKVVMQSVFGFFFSGISSYSSQGKKNRTILTISDYECFKKRIRYPRTQVRKHL